MKKNFFGFAIAAAIMVGGFLCGWLPASSTKPSSVGGTYYVNSVVSPVAYGKVDTFVTTGTDSIKGPITGNVKSITFSNSIWKVAGTPTVTAALYVSSDGGATYDNTPVLTYTVSPTALYTASLTNTAAVVKTYLVNTTGGGNPYTNYLWVHTGSAASTSSVMGSVMVRN